MPTKPEQELRNLTDGDVKAIANEMESRLVSRFYSNLGRGVWGLAWKAAVLAIIALAVYGMFQDMKH